MVIVNTHWIGRRRHLPEGRNGYRQTSAAARAIDGIPSISGAEVVDTTLSDNDAF